MRAAALLLSAAGLLLACGAPPSASDTASDAARAAAGPPQRVVSLDYCADQYVLKLLDRGQIQALSPDATAAFSYMRAAAHGLPTVRPRAEDVLALQPDLIVRSYGGGPNAAAFFTRAGVPVVQLGYAADVQGVRDVLRETAAALRVPERGAALLEQMDARLAAVGPAAAATTHEAASAPPRALYMTPAGYTAGPGTLVHALITAAGLANDQDAPGWRPLPLERLAYSAPDLVAAADFGAEANIFNAWTSARHPVARRQLDERPVVPLEGAWTACGGWFVMDAVEALAAARLDGPRGRGPAP